MKVVPHGHIGGSTSLVPPPSIYSGLSLRLPAIKAKLIKVSMSDQMSGGGSQDLPDPPSVRENQQLSCSTWVQLGQSFLSMPG